MSRAMLALSLVALGCSDGESTPLPASSADALTDAASPEDVGESDVVAPAEDVADEQAMRADVPAGPTAEEQALCAQYCAKRSACALPNAGAACQAECLDLVAGDEAWANAIRCAVGAACANVGGCVSDPIETQPPCVELCSSLDECGALPSLILGADADACTLYCSIQVKYNPLDFGAVAECVNQNLGADCSDRMIVECSPSTNAAVCQQVCTSVTNAEGQACGVPPEGFDTEAACLTACGEWTTAQRWIARFCVGRTDCGEGASVCFPPPEQAAEGAVEACQALWTLCGGVPAFTLPKNPDLCAWILTGVSHGLDSYDLANTPACLDARFPLCPDDPNFIYGCLVEQYEGCSTYCDKLATCNVPGVTPEGCAVSCNYGHATAPEATEALISCVETTGCTGLGACFPDDGE